MKRFWVRIICGIFIFCVLILCGCSSGQKSAVMGENSAPQGLLSYGNNTIPDGVFQFLLSQSKTTRLYAQNGNAEDSKEFWDTKNGDKTLGQTIFDETLNSALAILYYADVAQKNGVTLTQQQRDNAEQKMQIMVDSYGSRDNFNNEMLKFKTGYNTLRDYYLLEELAQKGADILLGEGGADAITQKELVSYYEQNFVTLRHIFLNTAYNDPSTKQPLTQQQKQEKSALADRIMQEVNQNGKKLTDFKQYNEDGIINQNPDGVTIPLGELLDIYASVGSQNNVFYNYYFLFSKVPGFAQGALLHDIGEVTRVENSGVGIILVERVALTMDMFETFKEPIERFIIRPKRMNDTVQKLKSQNQFTIDTQKLSGFTVQDSPVMRIVQQSK